MIFYFKLKIPHLHDRINEMNFSTKNYTNYVFGGRDFQLCVLEQLNSLTIGLLEFYIG